MRFPIRFILATAALSLSSIVAIASEIKGAPPDLVGKFVEATEDCSDTFLQSDKRWFSITRTTIQQCSAKICEYSILSHTKEPYGYLLRVVDITDGSRGAIAITVLDRNHIEEQGEDSVTLTRCESDPPLDLSPSR
jgi:hypothetical protein